MAPAPAPRKAAPAPAPAPAPVAAPPRPAPVAAAPAPMEEAATMLAPNPLLSGAKATPPPPPAADADADATMFAQNPLMQGGSFTPPSPPMDVESDATMMAPNPLMKAPPAPPPPVESDATFIVTAEQLEAMKKAAAEAEAARKSAEEPDDRTFVLPVAWLVVNADSPAPSEYRLAASNSLGRADDSHVVIARAGVSRKHAMIVAGAGGFLLQDLGSQNGTYVNGQRIKEHPLKNGDQIVIGDTKLIFKQ